MADGRNAHGKSLLEFGKASMYVIAENGLQKETAYHQQSKRTGEKNSLSGKNIIFSRTKAIAFSWKEIHHNASEHSNNVRMLDLNDSMLVNGNKKRYINTLKTQGFVGAERQKYQSIHCPHFHLNALGVNDLKQTANDQERNSCLCPDELVEDRKSTICGCKEDKWAEKKTLPRRSCTDSMPSKPADGNSANVLCVEQDANESANNNFLSVRTVRTHGNPTGKGYLKRIFYAKGNDLWNPVNQECSPQIRKKTKNQTGTTLASLPSSSNGGKMEQDALNCLHKNNQLLLPLKISFLKNREKQKHHVNSIVKLPTVVDKKTGQVHLAVGAIAYEPSDYNRWSRRQKRIPPGSTKTQSSFPFPLIAKNSK